MERPWVHLEQFDSWAPAVANAIGFSSVQLVKDGPDESITQEAVMTDAITGADQEAHPKVDTSSVANYAAALSAAYQNT